MAIDALTLSERQSGAERGGYKGLPQGGDEPALGAIDRLVVCFTLYPCSRGPVHISKLAE